MKLSDQDRKIIREVFNTMDYGPDYEDVSLAEKWIKDQNGWLDKFGGRKLKDFTKVKIESYNGKTICYMNVLAKADKNNWQGSLVQFQLKPKLVHKFIIEIENNSELLCQLELLIRGIPVNDTKTIGIPLLIESCQYYSRLHCKANFNSKMSQEIDDKRPLHELAHIILSIFDIGSKKNLYSEPKISLVAYLLAQLLKNTWGEDVIEIIPCNYKSIIYQHQKSSMIVFENSDLNSACTAALKSAWNYQQMLSTSIKTIFVQENIFESFATKLKSKLATLKVGPPNIKSVDIAIPTNKCILEDLKKVVAAATKQGIEVYQVNEMQSEQFIPTLIIGSKVFTNNVIKIEENIDGGELYVLPFRTLNEAVALANNVPNAYGVSVWTDHIGLANEITSKLKVNKMWINCLGIYTVSVDNFLNRISFHPISWGVVFENLEVKAKSAQISWKNEPLSKKIEIFQKFAEHISFKAIMMKKYSKKDVDEMVSCIYNLIALKSEFPESTLIKNGCKLTVSKEPKGVLWIHSFMDKICGDETKFILKAIFDGNSVIVRCSEEEVYIFEEFKNIFPDGLFQKYIYDDSETTTNKMVPFIIRIDNPIFFNTDTSVKKYIWSNVGVTSQFQI